MSSTRCHRRSSDRAAAFSTRSPDALIPRTPVPCSIRAVAVAREDMAGDGLPHWPVPKHLSLSRSCCVAQKRLFCSPISVPKPRHVTATAILTSSLGSVRRMAPALVAVLGATPAPLFTLRKPCGAYCLAAPTASRAMCFPEFRVYLKLAGAATVGDPWMCWVVPWSTRHCYTSLSTDCCRTLYQLAAPIKV